MVQSGKISAGEHMMHRAYENLYKEFSPEQASVIADIFETQKEILEIQKEEIIYKARNSLNSEFATKSDLRAEIAEAKAELKEDIATLDSRLINAELKLTKEIAEAKVELKQDIANLRTEMFKTILASAGFIVAAVGLMIKFIH